MESLIKVQTNVALNIQKARTNCKKSPKDRITVTYLMTRLESLEEFWLDYKARHVLIIEESDSEKLQASAYISKDHYADTEESYIEYKVELKEALLKVMPATSPSDGSKPESSYKRETQVRLPKITIPVFSGKYTEWPSFKDLFVSLIHSNEQLDNVQKLQYLKGHLSGEAEQLLRNISVTNSNYYQCWNLLTERYNNKRYLANNVLNQLFSQKSLVTESAAGLKDLVDTTTDSLNALENMGVQVNTWDLIIIHIVCLKLDSETRKQWELSSVSNLGELPTFVELKQFLENRFKALESIETKKYTFNKGGSSSNSLGYVKRSFHVTYVKCQYCNEEHKLANCKRFGKEKAEDRNEFVQTNRLCFNCLGDNHSIKFCRQPSSCRICKRRHHSLLHVSNSTASSVHNQLSSQTEKADVVPTRETASPSNEESVSHVTSHFSTGYSNNIILLATALVTAESNRGNWYRLRTLVDQGSQASFVTEATVQLLGLKKSPIRGVVSGLGGDTSKLIAKSTVKINVQSLRSPEFKLEVNAYVLSSITSLLPTKRIEKIDCVELEGIVLADPEYHTPNKINVLLGADVYGQILRDGIIKDSRGTLVAQNTYLGWILSGQARTESSSVHCYNIVSMHNQVDLNEQLKLFWELESEPTCSATKILTKEEEKCEEIFSVTTRRDQEGRYIVKLPFRSEQSNTFRGSREIAAKRFSCLERKLMKNDRLYTEYSRVINEYLHLGHMQRIAKGEDEMMHQASYLPHHAVIREDKTTPSYA